MLFLLGGVIGFVPGVTQDGMYFEGARCVGAGDAADWPRHAETGRPCLKVRFQ